jgi:hypothetical protein
MMHHHFRLKVIWHTWSMASLVLCQRLAESEVTVMYIDWLHWWYNHIADVFFPSTALAFVNKMVRNLNLHHLVQSKWKSRRKTVGIEEKLDVISQLEKGTQVVGIHCNVRFAHTSALAIPDNADRIRESAMSETEVFVYSPIGRNCTKNYRCESLTLLLHKK